MITNASSRRAGAADVFVIALWSAVFFGLLEGVALCLTRLNPLIEAAHKVSIHALYAPLLVDVPLWCLLALALLIPLQAARRWIGPWALPVAYGVFCLAGVYTVLSVPRILHQSGAALLALGLTAAFLRRLRGRERGFTDALRCRLVWLPLIAGGVVLGVLLYEGGREMRLARQLPPPAAQAANAVVIVMDTMRADTTSRLLANGKLPNLAALAAQGVRFEHAWSTTSWSLPSQASILTGSYPHEHGADWPTARMRSDVITLPGLLRERGYVTGAFSGNSSWVVPEYLGRGFLRFRAYQIEHLLRRTVHGRKIDKQIEARGYHSAGRGRTAQAIRDEFLQFVDDYPDRPFFAYLCFMDVNRAFHDSRLNRGEPEEAVLRAYEEAAVDLDREIGELLAELRRRGKSRNTIVAVTSDHGESFGPKIAKDHLPTGHGTSLYREQFQVPLIVSFPGHIASGLIVNDTVSIRQIPATVLDLLRIENSRIPGNSLLRAAGAQNCVLGSLRFVESAREDRSMVCGAWHYIATRANQETGTAKELFNLAEDPLESRNLAGAGSAAAVQTDIERQMQRLLTAGAATSALLAFAGKE